MLGDFTVLYLSDHEYRQAIDANKLFSPSYEPYLSIRIIQHISENVFEGLICGEKNFDRSKALRRNNPRPSGILDDYLTRKVCAFTFDGIRYFRIINMAYRSDTECLAVFTFQHIRQSPFSERNTAFMIMPFGYDPLNKFYEMNIRTWLWDCDLHIHVDRSDYHPGTDVIADTILEQIRKAEIIICDISHCNKNVFFEAGYAKGIGKEIIFLLEKNKPAEFFDVNHVRRIEYSYDNPEEFRKLLQATIINVRNKQIQ